MSLPTLHMRSALLAAGLGAMSLARAQAPCDELEILHITYPAFGGTSLQVHVEDTDPGGFFFSYPEFMLIDAGGDTVAQEQVEFFGISAGEQVHHMDLRPGMSMPASPFTGSLVLRYMGLEGDNTCTWPLDAQELCPAPPCTDLTVFVQSNGGMPVDAAFTWHITDVQGATVADGTIALEAGGDPGDMRTVCVPPGELVLHVEGSGPAGSVFTVGVSQNSFSNGPVQTLTTQGASPSTAVLGFSWFPRCAAESDCDELQIVDVGYSAFSDTALQVVVINNSPNEIFGYPRFLLLDAAQDTVASEDINVFGIGQGPQTHYPVLEPGMALPTSPFTGTLVLTYMTGEAPDNTCVFPLMADDLCPPPPCDSLYVFVSSIGEPEDAVFTWHITDAEGTQAEGQIAFDGEGGGTIYVPACLPPGAYMLHMAQPFSSEGEFSFGATQGIPSMQAVSAVFVPNGDPSIPNDLPFDYYLPCAEAGNGVAETDAAAPSMRLLGDRLEVNGTGGRPLGLLEVLDLRGRPVRRVDARSTRAEIDLSGVAAGLYLLRSAGHAPWFPTQRFIRP